MPTEADVSKLLTTDEIPNPPTRRYVGKPPKNLFVVNDAYDAAVALYWTENNILNNEGESDIQSGTYSTAMTAVILK